jgi:hypothetical protein
VSVAEISGSRMTGGRLFGASSRWTEICFSMTVKKVPCGEPYERGARRLAMYLLCMHPSLSGEAHWIVNVRRKTDSTGPFSQSSFCSRSSICSNRRMTLRA